MSNIFFVVTTHYLLLTTHYSLLALTVILNVVKNLSVSTDVHP